MGATTLALSATARSMGAAPSMARSTGVRGASLLMVFPPPPVSAHGGQRALLWLPSPSSTSSTFSTPRLDQPHPSAHLEGWGLSGVLDRGPGRSDSGALATITTMLKRLAAVAACLSVLALAGCGNESDGSDTATDTSSPSESPSESSSEPADAGGATTTCEYPSDGQEPAREVQPPEAEAPAEGTVSATMTTNFGDIGITLDAATTPCTVNSFVSLAEQGFYDDTPCPRIGDQEGFGILQCG